jgi:alkylated DNA repair dioxygenase AlkB
MEYQGSFLSKTDISDPGIQIDIKTTMDTNETITITFGDQVENQVGMEKIGNLRNTGFSVARLEKACKKFEKEGYDAEVIDLNKLLPKDVRDDAEEAAILVVRNGVNALLGKRGADKMLKEQKKLEWDTTAKMRGKVVNKHARRNVCYADFSQEADIEEGKGTIYDFADLPYLQKAREALPRYLGSKAEGLLAEGNYYFDTSVCGISFHGDSERRIVVAIRLGASIPLYYQWYYKTELVGKELKLMLNHGDLYVMSQKATGQDWTKRNIYTLRHAAGADKYTHAPLRKKLKKKAADKNKAEILAKSLETSKKKDAKIHDPPSKFTFVKKGLVDDAVSWVFSVGQTGFIPDSVGYGSMMKPTKKLKEWTVEDPSILKYEFRTVDIMPGGNTYVHTFKGLKAGKTVATDGYTGHKVRVTVTM